jgi:hypothetical protein
MGNEMVSDDTLGRRADLHRFGGYENLDHQEAVRLEATVMAQMGTPEEWQAALSNADVKSDTYRRIFDPANVHLSQKGLET